MQPVFIVSLPRAGSTLLQRLMMGHPKVGSCGEPWLALPLVYMRREQGVVTEYGHHSAACSIDSFIDSLPNGEDDYWACSADYLLNLYRASAPMGTSHFVDKTPRYYKILPEIHKMFPAAPVFLLLRNPLAIFASMLNFVKGDLRYLPMWRNDWTEGHLKMVEALSNSGSHYHVVRYESLLDDTSATLSQIMDALGLQYVSEQLDGLAQQQLDRGDPTGSVTYAQVDFAPLNSWRSSIDSSAKKRIALNWLRALPVSHWITLGYDRTATIDKLLEHEPACRYNFKDSVNFMMGSAYFNLGIHIFRKIHKSTSSKVRSFYN